MVVRGGDIEPGAGAEGADGIGQFRCREIRLGVFRQHVHGDAVGGVHARRHAREIPRRHAEQRVGQVRVVQPAQVLEHPHVVGDDHRQRRTGMALPKIGDVPLHGRRQGPRIEAVRADTHGPAAPAGAKGQHAIKAVQQE